MATEIFKQTMQELKDDYIEYAKSLNEQAGVNPISLKLSLLEYSQLYMDYFAITLQDNPEEDYPEEDNEENPEGTY